MRKLVGILLMSWICLVVACTPNNTSKESADKTNNHGNGEKIIEGKVVHVMDGDTVSIVDAGLHKYDIRLSAIDAPENKQDFSQTSKTHLAELILGKEIVVQWSKTDRYGRLVGRILKGNIDVNLEQIRAGLAWHYKKYAEEQVAGDRALYSSEEIKARDRKLGLWSISDPVPPWDWRAGRNNPNLEGVPEGSIIGNRASKIYHTPGCNTYAKVSAKNRVVFATAADAVGAGYRVAKNCS